MVTITLRHFTEDKIIKLETLFANFFLMALTLLIPLVVAPIAIHNLI